MDDKRLVHRMVKLQVLFARWMERNTAIHYATHRDLEKVLMGGKRTTTYGVAMNNLKVDVEKHCKNDYLIESILKLEEEVKNSDIYDLKFGVEPKEGFSELESMLDTEGLNRRFFMLNEMVGIKYIVENLGLTDSAVKQACQQERLLNTRKVGNNWMVHIPECRAYWNILDTEEGGLYKDWVY